MTLTQAREKSRTTTRLRISVQGLVQGVGFRPFVWRLAQKFELCGWVCNTGAGVVLEVEGPAPFLHKFLLELPAEKPPLSRIYSLEPVYLDPAGYKSFEIIESTQGEATALIMPDVKVCEDCLRDIRDPANARYRYPFTCCTHCGPRYSVIESLPYDRANTTMKKFPMCSSCRREYEDPDDRRFQAQTTACPVCGPHAELWDTKGRVISKYDEALRKTAGAVREGKIAAVKGLGGFHLIVDALRPSAVAELRKRKHREEKPFALMMKNLEMVKKYCFVSAAEERLLTSTESPIVLLKKKDREDNPSSVKSRSHRVILSPAKRDEESLSSGILRFAQDDVNQLAPQIAPENPYLGVMLPYTPLHALLLEEIDGPVVATSGNLSEEPMVMDEYEAFERLGGIADLFLVHNRPIATAVDDSIVRIVMDRELVLRRARGYAPLPISVAIGDEGEEVFALGGQLKNTLTFRNGRHFFISQHLGDLENESTLQAFRKVEERLRKIYGMNPRTVCCDLHPDYLSTREAENFPGTLLKVQHHYAHILACMAENEIEGPVLGIAWDGTGYGADGTIWGGEFLIAGRHGFERFAHLRTFMLPGGERAIREPRLSALGLLYEMSEDEVFKNPPNFLKNFQPAELGILQSILKNGRNTPRTSSVGRLFDAVSAMWGFPGYQRFEGQAAMSLEFAIGDFKTNESYPLELIKGNAPVSWVSDWEPMISSILGEIQEGESRSIVAAKFHNTLAEAAVEMSKRAGLEKVALGGGCFQNVYLLTRCVSRLKQEGFKVYWPQRVPPNDGGLSLGQAVCASQNVGAG